MTFDHTNPVHREALRHVRSVQGALPFNCQNGLRDEDAAANLVEGKPAFASGHSYSNAYGSLLSSAANRLGSIEAAQDELCNEMGDDEFRDEALLARLYPLNRAGELDLLVAYQRCGTWIETADIRRRVMAATGLVPKHYSEPTLQDVAALVSQDLVGRYVGVAAE